MPIRVMSILFVSIVLSLWIALAPAQNNSTNQSKPDSEKATSQKSKAKYTLQSVNKMTLSGMTCEQCDEMFQECILEVDVDAPVGFEVCQILWDRCKEKCTGSSH